MNMAEECPKCGGKDVFVGNDRTSTRRCVECQFVWLLAEVHIEMLQNTIFVRENDLKIAINYLKDYAKWPWNRKARRALKILDVK